MLRGIIGLEIPIRRLVCKWKLSQTRSLEDRLGVVEGLPREDGLHGSRLAELMRDVEPP